MPQGVASGVHDGILMPRHSLVLLDRLHAYRADRDVSPHSLRRNASDGLGAHRGESRYGTSLDLVNKEKVFPLAPISTMAGASNIISTNESTRGRTLASDRPHRRPCPGRGRLRRHAGTLPLSAARSRSQDGEVGTRGASMRRTSFRRNVQGDTVFFDECIKCGHTASKIISRTKNERVGKRRS